LKATIATNKSKEVLWEAAGVMFDGGSIHNMISKTLVARVKLEPQIEGEIRKPNGNKGLVVVDMPREDGTIAQIRAYVVDSITNAPEM
jgi:hypothetical protein